MLVFNFLYFMNMNVTCGIDSNQKFLTETRITCKSKNFDVKVKGKKVKSKKNNFNFNFKIQNKPQKQKQKQLRSN